MVKEEQGVEPNPKVKDTLGAHHIETTSNYCCLIVKKRGGMWSRYKQQHLTRP